MIKSRIHDSIVVTELYALFVVGTEIIGHEILNTKYGHTGMWNYLEVHSISICFSPPFCRLYF